MTDHIRTLSLTSDYRLQDNYGGNNFLTMTYRQGLDIFESERARLVALAYRMLGDVARAEDMVQEAWLRWRGREEAVESPSAWLVTTVTRLCLNELDSAKTRREESRGDRLPEPVALEEGTLGRVESLEQVSMAFLVMLQRLNPAERVVASYNRARIFMYERRFDEALLELDQGADVEPDHPLIKTFRGRVLYYRGQVEEARKLPPDRRQAA